MFESFELRKSATDDYDTDMGLEYEDSELYHSFREFYSDVLPEFRSVGKVINFKVCCNHEPHLRGNVYIQYKRETDAQQAFAKFNARWYAGRQLSCEFVNISKWKSAICGLFFAKRCPKGKACNFLHVFRNPGNEFWEADRDFEVSARGGRHDDRNASSHRHWRSHDDWRMRRSDGRHRGRDTPVSSRHRKRSRSRSKSRPRRGSAERDTSVSRSHHRNRSRSRSRERSQSKSQKISAERNSSVSRTNDHKSRSASRERSRSRSESRQMSPDKDHISPLRRHRRRSPSREEDSDSEAALSRKRKYRSARSQSVSSENSDASEQDEHSKASSSSNKKTKKHKKNKKSHKKKKKKRSNSAQKREVDNPAEEDGSVVSDERNGPSEKTGTNGHGNSHTNSEVWTSATELA